MKSAFLFCLLLFAADLRLLAQGPADEATDVPMQTLAASTLKSALSDFVRSDLGRIYFGDVDPEKIVIDTTMLDPGLKGWLVRWRYEKDIGTGANPNKNSGTLTVPVATSARGVLLDISITEGAGSAGLWAQRVFSISRMDDFGVNYFLVAGSNEEKLRAGLEVLCSNVAAKMKAALETAPSK